MPVCFTLTRLTNPEAGPVKFSEIDDEMCKDFGVQPDPIKYYFGWYDCIGFRVALGKSFDQIREELCSYIKDTPDQHSEYYMQMLRVLAWLQARFTTASWYETKH